MPLLDHFRPPLAGRRNWHGFHNAWATTIAYDLNARLPAGYFAEPNVQFNLEIDVAANFADREVVVEGRELASPDGANEFVRGAIAVLCAFEN